MCPIEQRTVYIPQHRVSLVHQGEVSGRQADTRKHAAPRHVCRDVLEREEINT